MVRISVTAALLALCLSSCSAPPEPDTWHGELAIGQLSDNCQAVVITSVHNWNTVDARVNVSTSIETGIPVTEVPQLLYTTDSLADLTQHGIDVLYGYCTEMVLTHEVGHFLGIHHHLPEYTAVMYGGLHDYVGVTDADVKALHEVIGE